MVTGPWWQRYPRLGAALVVLVIAAALWGPSNLARVFPARAERPSGVGIPPAGVESTGARILPTVHAAPAQGNTYAFTMTQEGTDEPVTFDPCRPIHYVTRVGRAGPAGSRLVDEAVARISAATGLKFVSDGTTDEEPSDQRAAYQPDRYGDRWVPILIAWSDEVESPGLKGRTVGLGGGRPWRDTHGRLTYVTGMIRLDTPSLVPGLSGGGANSVRGVIMHELGHVLGAAHVDDPSQLMADGAQTPARRAAETDPVVAGRLGAGDRAGLARLGDGPCAPGI